MRYISEILGKQYWDVPKLVSNMTIMTINNILSSLWQISNKIDFKNMDTNFNIRQIYSRIATVGCCITI